MHLGRGLPRDWGLGEEVVETFRGVSLAISAISAQDSLDIGGSATSNHYMIAKLIAVEFQFGNSTGQLATGQRYLAAALAFIAGG